MNNGKLSKTDVKYNKIYLDESTCALFKPFVNQKIKIVDEDDCEFYFDVNWQLSNRKNKMSLVLSQTKDFIIQWGLKEGDVLSFKYNSDICTFTVDITKKGGSHVLKETSYSLPEAITIDEQSKTDILSIIPEIYQSVVNEYNNTFNRQCYLPTKASQSSLVINGFTERNLTFNFCHSYLKQNPNAIVWQEIPITSVNRQHVDSIIIDKDWIIYIEAKRLYDLTHFELLLKDLDRIKEIHSNIPLPKKHPTNKAIVLLADHYYQGNGKKFKEKKYYDDFFTGKGVEEWSEICEDLNLAKKLTRRAKSSKINAVCDKALPISIKGDYNELNIGIAEEIVYTIYCGVFFFE